MVAEEAVEERRREEGSAHHVFPPGHQPLVNHLGGIIPPRVNVDAFFHDRVRPRPESLSNFVPARLYLGLGLIASGLVHDCVAEHRVLHTDRPFSARGNVENGKLQFAGGEGGGEKSHAV